MVALSIRPIVRLACAVALGSSFACATAPAAGRAPEVPPVHRDTIIGVPQQPGTLPTSAPPLNYRSGIFAYNLVQTTIITVGDTLTSLQDTLLTMAALTYSIQRSSDSLQVTAIVDSLSVSSTRDSVGPRILMAPVTIVLDPEVERLPPAPIDSVTAFPASCDSMDDAARAIARDIHIRLPVNALPRQRWTDSTSVAVCRGGIPMTATTVSSFELQDVQARGDSLTVQLLRRSTLVLSGAGLQGARRIAVTGTGTSETVFSYELRSGVFLESQGQSMLQLQFETIQQTEQVVQRSTSTVRRRESGA